MKPNLIKYGIIVGVLIILIYGLTYTQVLAKDNKNIFNTHECHPLPDTATRTDAVSCCWEDNNGGQGEDHMFCYSCYTDKKTNTKTCTEPDQLTRARQDLDIFQGNDQVTQGPSKSLPVEPATNPNLSNDYVIQNNRNLNVQKGQAGLLDRDMSLAQGGEEEPPADTSPSIMCSSSANPCYGTDEEDNMAGDSGFNEIYGKKGQDSITGWGGNDKIYGEEGNDLLSGHDGNDAVEGADGDDTMYGMDGDDFMKGGLGKDKMAGDLTGNEPTEAITQTGNDFMDGGPDNDYIYGSRGADRINGGEGNDTILQGIAETADPDGSKDVIDCGPGVYDSAWINKESDGDSAIRCEFINGKYVIADADNDGIRDSIDNCKSIRNSNQYDFDEDGIGDACDTDDDNDKVGDVKDNCDFEFNQDQKDSDHDRKGDACDIDSEAMIDSGNAYSNNAFNTANQELSALSTNSQVDSSIGTSSSNNVSPYIGDPSTWDCKLDESSGKNICSCKGGTDCLHCTVYGHGECRQTFSATANTNLDDERPNTSPSKTLLDSLAVDNNMVMSNTKNTVDQTPDTAETEGDILAKNEVSGGGTTTAGNNINVQGQENTGNNAVAQQSIINDQGNSKVFSPNTDATVEKSGGLKATESDITADQVVKSIKCEGGTCTCKGDDDCNKLFSSNLCSDNINDGQCTGSGENAQCGCKMAAK